MGSFLVKMVIIVSIFMVMACYIPLAQSLDTTPPVTTCTLTGFGGTGSPPTYTSPVTVTLTATDIGGSGVASTYYRVCGGTWSIYSGEFTISTSGNHNIDFYSSDNAGNNETQKSKSFTANIDRTPPVPTFTPTPIPTPTPAPTPTSTPTPAPTPTPTPNPTPGNDTAPPVTVIALSGVQGNGVDFYTSDVQVVLVANDGTGSGVNRTMIRLNNDSWKWYSSPFYVVDEGVTTVYYYSMDNSGNIEATNSKTFAVSKQSRLPCCGALVLPLLCLGVLALGATKRRKGEL